MGISLVCRERSADFTWIRRYPNYLPFPGIASSYGRRVFSGNDLSTRWNFKLGPNRALTVDVAVYSDLVSNNKVARQLIQLICLVVI
jgi:hypothetical protein